MLLKVAKNMFLKLHRGGGGLLLSRPGWIVILWIGELFFAGAGVRLRGDCPHPGQHRVTQSPCPCPFSSAQGTLVNELVGEMCSTLLPTQNLACWSQLPKIRLQLCPRGDCWGGRGGSTSLLPSSQTRCGFLGKAPKSLRVWEAVVLHQDWRLRLKSCTGCFCLFFFPKWLCPPELGH